MTRSSHRLIEAIVEWANRKRLPATMSPRALTAAYLASERKTKQHRRGGSRHGSR